jgi:hypothetical protein
LNTFALFRFSSILLEIISMKTFNSLFLLSGALSGVIAFPAASLHAPSADLTKPIPLDKLKAGLGALDSRSIPDFVTLLEQAKALVATTLDTPVFDATRQKVDVSGEHAFQMPDYAAGDVRGPCPGLNVLANHGYLPRNGVATILEYATAVERVLGMGIDTALVLGVYGTVLGGNPVSLTPGVSMGGPSNAPEAQNLLGNLLGLLGRPYASRQYFASMADSKQENLKVLLEPITSSKWIHPLPAAICTMLMVTTTT